MMMMTLKSKPKKTFEELLGIHQGYVKMVEVLTAKNSQQVRIIEKNPQSAAGPQNSKEYIIT